MVLYQPRVTWVVQHRARLALHTHVHMSSSLTHNWMTMSSSSFTAAAKFLSMAVYGRSPSQLALVVKGSAPVMEPRPVTTIVREHRLVRSTHMRTNHERVVRDTHHHMRTVDMVVHHRSVATPPGEAATSAAPSPDATIAVRPDRSAEARFPAMQQPPIERIAQRVVQVIDDRVIAERERMGRR